MPQLNYEHFASQIFWLIVTFGLLYFLMARVVLPRIGEVLEERQDKVDDDLARAERLKAEAEQVMAEYEATLGKAREEGAAVVKAASDRANAELAKRQAEFNRELGERTAAAEERIHAAKQQALAGIRSVAVETAIAATEKLIGSKPRPGSVEAAVDSLAQGQQ